MKSLLGIALVLVLAGCSKSEGTSVSKSGADPAAAPAPGAVVQPAPAPDPRTAASAAPAATDEAGECGGGGACGGACGGGGSCCGGAVADTSAVPTDAPADAAWSTMTVSGMHCGRCAKRIMAALGKVDGVIAVQADHGSGQVRWAVPRGKGDLKDVVAGEIRKLGYQPQL